MGFQKKVNYFKLKPLKRIRIIYRPIKNINSMIFLTDLHSALGDYCYSQVVLNSYYPIYSINMRLHKLYQLSPPKPPLLPSIIIVNMSPSQLGCLFSKTFFNKFDSIVIQIKNHNPTANYPSIIVTPPISAFLSFFRPPHISLISKLLHASTSISPFDPVPLSIFKF